MLGLILELLIVIIQMTVGVFVNSVSEMFLLFVELLSGIAGILADIMGRGNDKNS